ncbi:MAG: adenylyltransferase/cytidyltransferase family protein [Sulfitobacter sp.]|nr:adenylyltransferase/cytidyltransferase family protein [Sulfitobacter sp.]
MKDLALPPRRIVLTYGRFDLFDQDHAHFLRHLRTMGEEIIVGCTSDSLASQQGRPCQMPYTARRAMLEHCRFVDRVIPHTHAAQFRGDIVNYNVSTLVMGQEDRKLYDSARDLADVQYIPRRFASDQAIEWQPRAAQAF